MPCTKPSSDKVSEDKSPQEELKNLSTQTPITSDEVENTPSTSSKVESQNQPEIDEERETREEYQLAYANYQELAENEPNTYEEAIRSKL